MADQQQPASASRTLAIMLTILALLPNRHAQYMLDRARHL